jgi:WD40 repeat protein
LFVPSSSQARSLSSEAEYNKVKSSDDLNATTSSSSPSLVPYKSKTVIIEREYLEKDPVQPWQKEYILFTADYEGILHIWLLNKFPPQIQPPTPVGTPDALSITSKSVSFHESQASFLYSEEVLPPKPVPVYTHLQSIKAHNARINSMSFNGDGSVLYTGDGKGTVIAWRAVYNHRLEFRIL